MLCGHVMAMRISIHALREEGDALPARRRWSGSYFYPRPPRGGRRFTGKAALEWKLFLSTPSARRATLYRQGGAGVEAISIHALRGEGDSGRTSPAPRYHISIHALRGEGDKLPLYSLSPS